MGLLNFANLAPPNSPAGLNGCMYACVVARRPYKASERTNERIAITIREAKMRNFMAAVFRARVQNLREFLLFPFCRCTFKMGSENTKIKEIGHNSKN